jgi:transposase
MARVRRRVVEQVIKGKGAAEVAEVIGVSKQAVYSWVWSAAVRKETTASAF